VRCQFLRRFHADKLRIAQRETRATLERPFRTSEVQPCGFLSGSDFSKPDGQPAFIARRRVLLNDAPLRRAIDQRISLGNQLRRSLDILGLQQAPHGPDAMTQTGLASAVDQGTAFGHAHAFERRYSICHSNFKNTVIGPAGSNRRDPVPVTRRPAAARLRQHSLEPQNQWPFFRYNSRLGPGAESCPQEVTCHWIE